eukprot:12453656-Alexandrium_andersonii.AAC.1
MNCPVRVAASGGSLGLPRLQFAWWRGPRQAAEEDATAFVRQPRGPQEAAESSRKTRLLLLQLSCGCLPPPGP